MRIAELFKRIGKLRVELPALKNMVSEYGPIREGINIKIMISNKGEELTELREQLEYKLSLTEPLKWNV